MTLQEAIRYRYQMWIMIVKSKDNPELKRHYQDEYKRASKIASEAWHLSIKRMTDEILERRNGKS